MNGSELWTAQTYYPVPFGGDNAGNVYCATWGQPLTKFSSVDGSPIWTGEAGSAYPVVFDQADNVYFNSSYKTIRLNPVDGSQVWLIAPDGGALGLGVDSFGAVYVSGSRFRYVSSGSVSLG